MIISVNISRLEYHISCLLDEMIEVDILMQILREWEAVAAIDQSVEPDYFVKQRGYLENQRRWIQSRVSILETVVEEFTVYHQVSQNLLEEARDALNHTM